MIKLFVFRITYVSCDLGMMGQLIKMEVLEKLEQEFGNNTFRNDNLVLSATHTHSGPAGYMQYIMYSISSFGFVEDSFQVTKINMVLRKSLMQIHPSYHSINSFSKILPLQAIVNGIVLSIKRAHDNIKPSKLYYTEGELHDANINRSPTSYLANPEAERAQYEYDTDHTFAQLNILDATDDHPRYLSVLLIRL